MPASTVTVKADFVTGASDNFPFVDVPSGAWYEEGVRYVYEHGLMSGTSATLFSPDMTTTRSMIATILWRLEGSPAADYAMTFHDVDPDAWYGEAVRWAASEGIAAGYSSSRFGPHDPITREQLATMLYRYAQYKGCDVSASADLSGYADAPEINAWATTALQWACAEGLISGTSGTTLTPSGSAARAQVAVILMRFCENVAK